MPVPTVSTIAPASGPPTGGQLVQILGANFRLPTAPPLDVFPVPTAAASVRVTLGGVVAQRVDVVSDTRLLVCVPKYALPVDAQGHTLSSATVDVEVANVDDAGAVIPGEVVTEAVAYTYLRPGLTRDAGDWGLPRVSAALVDILRSECLANTVLETSTDYDPDTGTTTIEVAELPQLLVEGPSVAFNSFFTARGPYLVDGHQAGEGYRRRRHRVLDLTYEVVGVTEYTYELQTLIELLETVVDRNPVLRVEYPGEDPLELELHWITDPAYEKQGPEERMSDLKVFRGAIQLRGYPVRTFPGVAQDAIVETGAEVTTTTLEAPVQIGDNLPATQGAPTRSPPELATTQLD